VSINDFPKGSFERAASEGGLDEVWALACKRLGTSACELGDPEVVRSLLVEVSRSDHVKTVLGSTAAVEAALAKIYGTDHLANLLITGTLATSLSPVPLFALLGTRCSCVNPQVRFEIAGRHHASFEQSRLAFVQRDNTDLRRLRDRQRAGLAIEWDDLPLRSVASLQTVEGDRAPNSNELEQLLEVVAKSDCTFADEARDWLEYIGGADLVDGVLRDVWLDMPIGLRLSINRRRGIATAARGRPPSWAGLALKNLCSDLATAGWTPNSALNQGRATGDWHETARLVGKVYGLPPVSDASHHTR